MNEHLIAEQLFVEAERMGLDAPTERMIASRMGDVVDNTRNEVIVELMKGGYREAAQYVEDQDKLRNLENQE